MHARESRELAMGNSGWQTDFEIRDNAATSNALAKVFGLKPMLARESRELAMCNGGAGGGGRRILAATLPLQQRCTSSLCYYFYERLKLALLFFPSFPGRAQGL